jgi:hypothetical protein
MTSQRTSDESAPPELPEVPVCPDCMTENHPLADFCKNCARPLSSLATMDPVKQVYAQGWAYRQAAWGRPNTIVLIGMWLIFGPMLLLPACGFVSVIYDFNGLVTWDFDPLGFTVTAGILAIYAAILYRVTKRYLQHRARQPGQCVECGYDLRGLSEPRCPECGTLFDSEEELDEDESEIEEESVAPSVPITSGDVAYAFGVGMAYVLLAVSVIWDELMISSRSGEDYVFLVVVLGAIVTWLTTFVATALALLEIRRKPRSWLFWVSFAISLPWLAFVLPML